MTTMKITISESDIANVKSLLKDISGGANLALSRAINQGISTGKTQSVKQVGKHLNLKASRIKKDFDVRKATKANLSGAVWATGRPVGLLNFWARAIKKGYSVKVLKKGKRTLLKHAFKAKTKKLRNDGTSYETEHLWWRENYGSARTGTGTRFASYFARLPSGHLLKEPLVRLQGPRIEDVFGRSDILNTVQDAASEKMQTKLASEAERILQRHG